MKKCFKTNHFMSGRLLQHLPSKRIYGKAVVTTALTL